MNKFAPTSEGLLAPLQSFLQDKSVSEIILNKPQEIYIEKNATLTRHHVPEYDERTCDMLFQLIANENQQVLSDNRPLLSGNLLDGSRVQLVLPPVAKHHAFAIRRQVVRNFTLEDYCASQFYQQARPFTLQDNDSGLFAEPEKKLLLLYANQDWDQFIRQAIVCRKNIVISGGTSSGKTTYLNACLRHMPIEDRIITLEDTREINISHPNQVQLLAVKGEQGRAQVSMQDLVQCCLRLRPDRIIMGEIRGREIFDFISACSTGHEGSITSIHANNPRIAFSRMTQMYKLNHVPAMRDEDILRELQTVIDIIIQVAKTPSGRQVQSVYYKSGHLAAG